MSEGTSARRCTVERPDRSFCDREALPGAPFPICRGHASDLYAFVRDLVAGGVDITHHKIVVETSLPVVYYFQVDGRIKIGHAMDLRRRLRAYPPSGRLLAVEPGTQRLERARHRKFRDLLAEGREWFYPGPELLEHIRALQR